jgi:DNA polymerase I-like protein with 3'-5' exonuclease and polymerase domains
MYEPKYKLNKKDAKRWHALLTRHCLECPAKPGGKVKHNPKYAPLTPEENAEFEALCKKRSDKLMAHPKIQESLRHQRRKDRTLEKLVKRLERLVAKMVRTAKKKGVKIDVD